VYFFAFCFFRFIRFFQWLIGAFFGLFYNASVVNESTGPAGFLQLLDFFNRLNDKRIIAIEGTIHFFPEPALSIGSLMAAFRADMDTQAKDIIHHLIARNAVDDIKNLREILLQFTQTRRVKAAIALPVSVNASPADLILDYQPIFIGVHMASFSL
jgi:hypothetical protein